MTNEERDKLAAHLDNQLNAARVQFKGPAYDAKVAEIRAGAAEAVRLLQERDARQAANVSRLGGEVQALKEQPTATETWGHSAAEGMFPSVHAITGGLTGLGTVIGDRLGSLPDYLARAGRGSTLPGVVGEGGPGAPAPTNEYVPASPGIRDASAFVVREGIDPAIKNLNDIEAANPEAAMLGGVSGTLAGGVGQLAQKGAGAAFRAVGQGGGTITNALRKGVGGLLGYEATAPPIAVANTAARGGDYDAQLKAAKEAATSGTGIAASTLVGAGQGIGSRYQARMVDPARRMGRVIGGVKEAGGKLNPINVEPVDAVPGSVFASQAMQGLEEGTAGKGRLAHRSGVTVTRFNQMKLGYVRNQYDKDFDAILTANVGKRITPAKTSSRWAELVDENTTDEGEVLDEALDTTLKKFESILGTRDGKLGATDIIKIKRLVKTRSEPGMPPTTENRPYRLLGKAVAEDAETIDPRLQPLNQGYSRDLGKLEQANDIIYSDVSPEIAATAPKRVKAAGFFSRIGAPTQSAANTAPEVEKLAAIDPVYAKLILRQRAKNSQEALRYSPEGSDQVSAGGPVQSRTNRIWGFGPTQESIGILGARLGLPAARGATKFAPTIQSLSAIGGARPSAKKNKLQQIYEARQEKKRREEELAAKAQEAQIQLVEYLKSMKEAKGQ